MLRYIAWSGLIVALAAACGGSEESQSSAPGSTPDHDASADSAGGVGSSPATGGSAGMAGSGGTTQTGGSAGTAGAGGTSQTGGSAGAAGAGGTSQTGGSAGTAGTGGVGGTPATGGAAGTGGALPQPECKTADECTLHSDCCNCIALAPGESPPPCTIPTCFVDTCTSMGVSLTDGAQCNAGRCGVGFDCDQSHVLCLAPTPLCDPPTCRPSAARAGGLACPPRIAAMSRAAPTATSSPMPACPTTPGPKPPIAWKCPARAPTTSPAHACPRACASAPSTHARMVRRLTWCCTASVRPADPAVARPEALLASASRAAFTIVGRT